MPDRTADPTTGSRAVPIYQTTSYVFNDTEHAAQPVRAGRARQHLLADHEPDVGCARAAAGAARGGRRAAGLASGQAADTLACSISSRLGINHLGAESVRRDLQSVLPDAAPPRDQGRSVDPTDRGPAGDRRQDPAVFAETIGNPLHRPRCPGLGGRPRTTRGIPSSSTTRSRVPIWSAPSSRARTSPCTRRRSSSAGMGRDRRGVVDAGKFDWVHRAVPGLHEPDPTYNGVV